jgi:plastocyanin
MIRKLVGVAAVIAALVASSRCNDNNNVSGPLPTLTSTPPGATSTQTPPGPTLTATVTPPGPTMTPTPPQGANRIVNVGAGGGNTFVDTVTGNSTSTIPVGTTIEWVWISGFHSTTSGTCTTVCTEDGIWDSGVGSGMTFTHTFTQAGTFPYFCEAHGAMMQGIVIVQ